MKETCNSPKSPRTTTSIKKRSSPVKQKVSPLKKLSPINKPTVSPGVKKTATTEGKSSPLKKVYLKKNLSPAKGSISPQSKLRSVKKCNTPQNNTSPISKTISPNKISSPDKKSASLQKPSSPIKKTVKSPGDMSLTKKSKLVSPQQKCSPTKETPSSSKINNPDKLTENTPSRVEKETIKKHYDTPIPNIASPSKRRSVSSIATQMHTPTRRSRRLSTDLTEKDKIQTPQMHTPTRRSRRLSTDLTENDKIQTPTTRSRRQITELNVTTLQEEAQTPTRRSRRLSTDIMEDSLTKQIRTISSESVDSHQIQTPSRRSRRLSGLEATPEVDSSTPTKHLGKLGKTDLPDLSKTEISKICIASPSRRSRRRSGITGSVNDNLKDKESVDNEENHDIINSIPSKRSRCTSGGGVVDTLQEVEKKLKKDEDIISKSAPNRRSTHNSGIGIPETIKDIVVELKNDDETARINKSTPSKRLRCSSGVGLVETIKEVEEELPYADENLKLCKPTPSRRTRRVSGIGISETIKEVDEEENLNHNKEGKIKLDKASSDRLKNNCGTKNVKSVKNDMINDEVIRLTPLRRSRRVSGIGIKETIEESEKEYEKDAKCTPNKRAKINEIENEISIGNKVEYNDNEKQAVVDMAKTNAKVNERNSNETIGKESKKEFDISTKELSETDNVSESKSKDNEQILIKTSCEIKESELKINNVVNEIGSKIEEINLVETVEGRERKSKDSEEIKIIEHPDIICLDDIEENRNVDGNKSTKKENKDLETSKNLGEENVPVITENNSIVNEDAYVKISHEIVAKPKDATLEANISEFVKRRTDVLETPEKAEVTDNIRKQTDTEEKPEILELANIGQKSPEKIVFKEISKAEVIDVDEVESMETEEKENKPDSNIASDLSERTSSSTFENSRSPNEPTVMMEKKSDQKKIGSVLNDKLKSSEPRVRGIPASGRWWKAEKKRCHSIYKDSAASSSWSAKMKRKQEYKELQATKLALIEEKKQKKAELRERQRLNKIRVEENARKGEIVQVIKDSRKIKKMKRKQLRYIKTSDTSLLKKS